MYFSSSFFFNFKQTKFQCFFSRKFKNSRIYFKVKNFNLKEDKKKEIYDSETVDDNEIVVVLEYPS